MSIAPSTISSQISIIAQVVPTEQLWILLHYAIDSNQLQGATSLKMHVQFAYEVSKSAQKAH